MGLDENGGVGDVVCGPGVVEREGGGVDGALAAHVLAKHADGGDVVKIGVCVVSGAHDGLDGVRGHVHDVVDALVGDRDEA